MPFLTAVTFTLLALAGYRRDELEAYPFAVTHRRALLGILAVGAALVGATLFGIAVSRIDPSHPARWVFGGLAGALYFSMLLAFDCLFIVGTRKASGAAIAGRVILSLLVTAFSSVSLDAVFAGKRLDAEIDSRRMDADLAARHKQAQVHDLPAKAAGLMATSKQVQGLEQRLAKDPDTPEFSSALAKAKGAEQRLRSVKGEVEPQLTELRSQIAQLAARAQGSEPPDERANLKVPLAEARAKRDALAQRLRDAERGAESSSAKVELLREGWRSELATQLEEARSLEQQAREQVNSAQQRTDQGAEASRKINQHAFQANIVEQSAAYWGLAKRERAYLVVGLAIWAACLTLELLAVLVKARLTPDALDLEISRLEDERERENAEADEFNAEVGRMLRDEMKTQKLRLEMAKAELEALAQVHQSSIDLVVDAWIRIERERQAMPATGPMAGLERQFDELQSALAEKAQAVLRHMSARRHEDATSEPARGAVDAGLEPVAL